MKENNCINEFTCENCNTESFSLIYKAKYDRIGYLCQFCWNNLNTRLKKIYNL